MEALLWNSATGELTYRTDYPIPSPGLTQVLVRVDSCGVCGTDIKNMNHLSPDNPQEIILGHEISGIVESVGSENTSTWLPNGSRVFINPNPHCKMCSYCLRGDINHCPSIKRGLDGEAVGSGKNGGLAQYVCVEADTVFKLPDDLPTLEGALCEPLSCIAHGLNRLGIKPIKAGVRVLIFGAGVKGLLWAVTLRHKGVRDITICEEVYDRRMAVKEMNFNFKVVDCSTLEELKKPAYDTIIDCSGNAKILSLATRIAKPKASICLFGCTPDKSTSSVCTMDVAMKELRIFGCLINPFSSPDGVVLTQDLYEAGHLNFDELNIKVYSLKMYKEAIDLLSRKQITKLVFKIM